MPAKPLGQVAAVITTPTLVYQPASGVRATNLVLVATNHSVTDTWLTVYHDIDGTTYNDASTIESEIVIVANSTRRFNVSSMSSAGALAVVAEASSRITCTLYGIEITV